MTEPRDPIDEWLGTDVELLQPPPGAFARVHRTARRRKAIRAMSTVAGAAVVIAAAVTLPQIAVGLLPGHGGPDRVATGKSHSPSNRGTSPATGSASPTSSGSRTIPPQPQAGITALGSTGQKHPAAPGFKPTSVTFVGPSTGAVVGQADCRTGSCTSVAGTPDYGLTWYKVGAPPAGKPSGGLGVSQIRFLHNSDGWIYGPQLYATHNGGLTWHKIELPGRVIDLSTVGRRVFAVIAKGCAGTSPHYAANCASIALMSAPFQADRSWRRVPGASTGIAEAPGGLQLTGQHGYLMTKGLLYAGPITGGPWHAVSNASPSAPACLRGGQLGPWLLAPAPDSRDLFLACDRPTATQPTLTLYRSSDQGVTWRALGPVAEPGTAKSLAVAPTSGWLVLATNKGIFYSKNHGSWHSASLAQEPAGGFSYVGMTTTTQGVAVPVNAGLREIFITLDGGLTWRRAVIP